MVITALFRLAITAKARDVAIALVTVSVLVGLFYLLGPSLRPLGKLNLVIFFVGVVGVDSQRLTGQFACAIGMPGAQGIAGLICQRLRQITCIKNALRRVVAAAHHGQGGGIGEPGGGRAK